MNKFKKTLATALALGLVFGQNPMALADENKEQSPALFEILTADGADEKDEKEVNTEETEAKEEPTNKENPYESDPAYKEEFDARYALYEKVEHARHIEEIDESKFIDILNKKEAGKEDLEKARSELSKLIDQASEKVALDLDIEAMKEDVKDYILYGKLFYGDKLDKSDIKNLYLAYEAAINSYSYTKSDDEVKKDLNPGFEEVYNYILEVDKKVEEKTEITEEDKKKTSELFEKLSETIRANKGKNLIYESTDLEGASYLSDTDESDGEVKNKDSAFYNADEDERPGIKQAYLDLTDDQRTYLDNINKNNDTYVDDEEIKADGKYELPLDDSNFIKPFYGNPDKEEEKKAEISSTEVANESKNETSKDQTPATSTPDNPQSGTPETVTISKGDGDKNTGDKEEKNTSYTTAASQVRTGIKGVGYLGIILIIALGAYFVMVKKKKDEEENK
ncbi:hypothetical protein [uncultured Anaerococcus sp.]|uniref:hypothetical protein n=1 Tax=uncultured Anaerococcus sp. TaxID=293428 RepID=UPI0025F885B8|nr:hypothetical protein [uncultured Anaerococcus sp.]